MFRHILVATDGSELSLKAASLAGDLARSVGARLSIVKVLDEQSVVPMAWAGIQSPVGGASEDNSVEDIRGQLEADARQNDLKKTAEAAGNLSSAPELACVWGHPASEICDVAQQGNVDLIVIGSHGRTGIKSALLGSVSHAVANRAPCAVMITR
jgi:nucleotide-binding universal stress UspA family protein